MISLQPAHQRTEGWHVTLMQTEVTTEVDSLPSHRLFKACHHSAWTVKPYTFMRARMSRPAATNKHSRAHFRQDEAFSPGLLSHNRPASVNVVQEDSSVAPYCLHRNPQFKHTLPSCWFSWPTRSTYFPLHFSKFASRFPISSTFKHLLSLLNTHTVFSLVIYTLHAGHTSPRIYIVTHTHTVSISTPPPRSGLYQWESCPLLRPAGRAVLAHIPQRKEREGEEKRGDTGRE